MMDSIAMFDYQQIDDYNSCILNINYILCLWSISTITNIYSIVNIWSNTQVGICVCLIVIYTEYQFLNIITYWILLLIIDLYLLLPLLHTENPRFAQAPNTSYTTLSDMF